MPLQILVAGTAEANRDDSPKVQLRGKKGTDEGAQALEAIVNAKEALESQLNRARATKKRVLAASPDEAAAIAMSYLEDTRSSVAQIATSAPDFDEDDRDFDMALDLHSSSEDHQLATGALQDALLVGHLTSNELASMVLSEDVEHFSERAIRELNGVIAGRTRQANTGRRQRGRRSSKTATTPSGSSPSGLGSNFGEFQLPGKLGRMQLPNGKLGRFKLPELGAVKKLRKLKESQGDHDRRLQADHPGCEKCSEEDYTCNCRRLRDCAQRLSTYDTALLVLGGFVSVTICNG